MQTSMISKNQLVRRKEYPEFLYYVLEGPNENNEIVCQAESSNDTVIFNVDEIEILDEIYLPSPFANLSNEDIRALKILVEHEIIRKRQSKPLV